MTDKTFVLDKLRDGRPISVIDLSDVLPRASVRRILGELRKAGYQIDVVDRRPSGNVVQLVW